MASVESIKSTDNSKAQDKPFLRINNLIKEFGDNRVVNNVSVTINKGEIFALLGSGAQLGHAAQMASGAAMLAASFALGGWLLWRQRGGV